MTKDTFFSWIAKQDPDTMPFRPGVAHTQGFGIRNSMNPIRMGASPAHLGNDRGSYPTVLHMPFDGKVRWKQTGGVAGSVLQLIPSDIDAEIQVFHTRCDNIETQQYARIRKRGEQLTAVAGNIGLSTGVHTHTEFIVKYQKDVVEALRERSTQIYYNGIFNNDFIYNHCQQYNLKYSYIVNKLKEQVLTWNIEELWDTFAVRASLPAYRQPHWGKSRTVHLCTKTYLQI
jgi:hypothetical protein